MHTLPADAMDVEQQTSTHSVRFADDVEVAGQQHREPLADASSSSTSSRLMARRFSSPATSTPVSSAPAAFPSSPSREEERDFIINAVAERLRPNQTCFIISMGWWNAWKAYAGVDAVASYTSSSDLLSSPRPGPINNLVLCHDKDCPSLMELCALRVLEMQKRGQVSVIAENIAEEATAVTRPPQLNVDVLEFLANFDKTLMRRALCRAREMKAGLIEGKDCVAVPAPAWKALHAWYGGGPIIPRPVIGVGVRQRLQVELYPVTLLVLPLNSGRSSDRETYRFTFSPLDQIKTVRRAICGRFLHPPHKVELFWHLSSADAEHLSDLELTLGQMGLQDGSLVSLQRAMHADPLGLAAPTAVPQALPPQQPQQLPQNDGRPLASLAQPL